MTLSSEYLGKLKTIIDWEVARGLMLDQTVYIRDTAALSRSQ